MRKSIVSLYSFLLLIFLLMGCGTEIDQALESISDQKTSESQSSTQEDVKKETPKSSYNEENENTDTSTSDQDEESEETSNPKSILNEKELMVHFIDLGQGSGALVIGPGGETLLYDGGQLHGDAGDEIVPYLKNLGISKVDVVIPSHPHADHINGLDNVIRTFDIGAVYMPKVSHTTKTFEDLLVAIKEKGLKIKEGKAGVEIPLGDMTINMIAPNSTDYDNLNEWSIAIRFEYGNTSFIFTGDAEHQSENEMLQHGMELGSDVYLVGHHGSSSSSSTSFLDAVNPTYVVIQVGKNSYGHPHQETLDKLASRHIKVYRNDISGDIIFKSDGQQITVIQGKEEIGLPGSNMSQDNEDEDEQSTSTQSDISGLRFIASKNSDVYHEVDCPGGANRIKDSNALYFDSEEEAQSSGRRMCRSRACPLN
jgi:competence protein ComEC